MRGIEGFVLVAGIVIGALLQPRAVVGVDDGACQIAEAQSEHIAAADSRADQPVHVTRLGRAQSLPERSAVEDRLDGGLGHQQCLGPPLGQAPSVGLRAVAAGQGQAQKEDGDQHDGGEDHKKSDSRLATLTRLFHIGNSSASSPPTLRSSRDSQSARASVRTLRPWCLVDDAGAERTGFSDVDASASPSFFIDYLDGARRAPAIVEAKEWSLEHLHLTWGQRVLDVGCGTGEDVVAMARIVGPSGRAVGIDSSAAMIAEAQRRHHLPEGSFQVGNGERLPFASGAFNACRAERTLQHLRDPETAVSEMARVLEAGGWIALVEPDWETLVIEGADPKLSRLILGLHIGRHLQPRMGRRLRGLLTANGFGDLAVAAGVVMHTDLETSRRAFGIGRAATAAESAQLISHEEADRWLADLQRADDEGRYFCSVTGFRAAGRKQ